MVLPARLVVIPARFFYVLIMSQLQKTQQDTFFFSRIVDCFSTTVWSDSATFGRYDGIIRIGNNNNENLIVRFLKSCCCYIEHGILPHSVRNSISLLDGVLTSWRCSGDIAMVTFCGIPNDADHWNNERWGRIFGRILCLIRDFGDRLG